MLPLWLFLAVSTLAFMLFRRYQYFAKWDHIPGHKAITSIPIIGHFYTLHGRPVEKLMAHWKKYGSIFRLDSGSLPTVWFCDYDQISRVFKMDVTTGRPHNKIPVFTTMWRTDKEGDIFGTVFSQGQRWNEQRKFIGTHLATRKQQINDILTDEANTFVNEVNQTLKTNSNQPIMINELFLNLINRVLWRMVTGRTVDRNVFETLKNNIRDTFKNAERGGVPELLQVYNQLAIVLFYITRYRSVIDIVKPVRDFLKQEIKGGSPDKEGTYVDRFMAEADEARKGSSFTGDIGRNNLLCSSMDLFFAGTDTVSSYLEWFATYMAHFPDVQEKMYKEIEKEIGSRIATVDDRANTHYVEAVIMEVMRHCPHMALTIQHQATADFTIDGHHIPKGTQLYYFSGGVHLDERIYPEPHVFKPERFLTKDSKFQPDERMLYFGIGKRRCIGEVLGRAQTYVFSVSLVQAFKLTSPGGERVSIDYNPGLNMHIMPNTKAVFTPRY